MSQVRYASVEQVVRIHLEMIRKFGGIEGIRDRNRLEAAVMAPRQTFGGAELYPTIIEKASNLGFGIVSNHPFLDGNKRTGQHVMEVFLELNGYRLDSSIDEDERIILEIARGIADKHAVQDWLRAFARKRE